MSDRAGTPGPAPVPGPVPDDAPRLVSAASLQGLNSTELAAALRPLWEDAGPLVSRLAGRPVSSWAQLIDLAEVEIASMSETERAELLAAHPRIGAPPAALAARSTLSLHEQGGDAGADPAVLGELDALNDRYEARFGFPFVAWVAGRSRRQMLAVLGERLKGDRHDELASGCAALVAIARDRLSRLDP